MLDWYVDFDLFGNDPQVDNLNVSRETVGEELCVFCIKSIMKTGDPLTLQQAKVYIDRNAIGLSTVPEIGLEDVPLARHSKFTTQDQRLHFVYMKM